MSDMIIRARAPLRLGLAGGGTDVSPYTDLFGGAVMNVTIDRYAYAMVEPLAGDEIIVESVDLQRRATHALSASLPLNGELDMAKAVYNRIIADYAGGRAQAVRISTFSEAPAGSGLGSSSAIVVALVQAFTEWLRLPLGEYDVAHLAYVIERQDIGLHGGRQDQYAAAFGGFNFMEFYANDRVIVNPLKIKQEVANELASRTLLCFTGVSRESATIIAQQSDNVRSGASKSIEAMHAIKASAITMKEALLRGDFDLLAETLREGWVQKRAMASGISNARIEEVQAAAMQSGAYAGKVSGAGGGGFMMLLVPLEARLRLIGTLEAMGCRVESCFFALEGATAWRVRS